MTNDEILQIVKAQFDTSSNGMASEQDSAEFISMMQDANSVLESIRVETDIQTALRLDSLQFGEPMFVEDTEGQPPASGDIIVPTHKRNKLTPVEAVGAVDLTFSNVRRNIMKDRLNEYLNQEITKRGSKDVALIAFNGDTTLAATTRTNKAKRITNGFVTRALADSEVNDVVYNKTTETSATIFGRMIEAMPDDYSDQFDILGYYVSPKRYLKYANEIGARQTTAGDQMLFGSGNIGPLYYMGMPVYPIYGMSDDYGILTVRKNLAVGFGQEITIGRDVSNREGLIKITVRMTVDANYVLGECIVLGQHSA